MKCRECGKKVKVSDSYQQDWKKGITCEECLDKKYNNTKSK